MYERFTDRSRKVMQLANQEAKQYNSEYIDTGHILIALSKEGSGVAANVLKGLDITLRKIQGEIEKIVQHGPGGDQVVMGRLPHTPRAKKVIEYSVEEAGNLNHNYVGTEHLILGLLREKEGVGSQVLMNLGFQLKDIREEVLNLLGHNMPPDNDDLATQPERDFLARHCVELGGPPASPAPRPEVAVCAEHLSARRAVLLVGEVGSGRATAVRMAADHLTNKGATRTAPNQFVGLNHLALATAAEGYADTLDGIVTQLAAWKRYALAVPDLHLYADPAACGPDHARAWTAALAEASRLALPVAAWTTPAGLAGLRAAWPGLAAGLAVVPLAPLPDDRVATILADRIARVGRTRHLAFEPGFGEELLARSRQWPDGAGTADPGRTFLLLEKVVELDAQDRGAVTPVDSPVIAALKRQAQDAIDANDLDAAARLLSAVKRQVRADAARTAAAAHVVPVSRIKEYLQRV